MRHFLVHKQSVGSRRKFPTGVEENQQLFPDVFWEKTSNIAECTFFPKDSNEKSRAKKIFFAVKILSDSLYKKRCAEHETVIAIK